MIDATNVRAADRKPWVELARRWHALPVAVVLDPGLDICVARNKARPDRAFGPRRAAAHGRRRSGAASAACSARASARCGGSPRPRRSRPPPSSAGRSGPTAAATPARSTSSATSTAAPPSCATLLAELGYAVGGRGRRARDVAVHPAGGPQAGLRRRPRGPRAGDARGAPHRHGQTAEAGARLRRAGQPRPQARALAGRPARSQIDHGLQRLDRPARGRAAGVPGREPRAFLDGLRSHYWLDGGRLAVAHAGLKEEMVGRGSPAVRDFALFGETSGETDEFGLPVRLDWAADYRGKTAIVYGHTPVPEAGVGNNTLCIDTGCVFGGRLTRAALAGARGGGRPGRARLRRAAPPLAPAASGGIGPGRGRRPARHDRRLRPPLDRHRADAAGSWWPRRMRQPRWRRWAASPSRRNGWSTCRRPCRRSETSAREGWLERPEEAFAFYRERGVGGGGAARRSTWARAPCIALCRDDATPPGARFGVATDEAGAIWTRTGRAFFARRERPTDAVLGRLRGAPPTPPACGTSSAPTGCCSTPRSCPGRPRLGA